MCFAFTSERRPHLTQELMGKGRLFCRGQMRKDVNIEINWGFPVSNKVDN